MSLVFLKLGGSLITDKNHPYTARLDKIEELAGQVAAALKKEADLHLLLGHGSGSFGHTAASQFDTRRGVHGPEAWGGFAEVWYQASALDRLVVEAFHEAGLPVVAFPAAASVTAHDGKVFIWDSYPLQTALANGLVPVVYGDVAFDEVRNGTILSTEELSAHLARQLQPQRILLAGQEAGIWADFPARKALIAEITPEILPQQASQTCGLLR